MDERMIACCGLCCADCDSYLASQAGDLQALERIAEEWRRQYGAPATAAYVTCDGCRATTGRLNGYCYACDVRACATAHEVANCAHCADYGCERIEAFMAKAPSVRAVLEQIRATL